MTESVVHVTSHGAVSGQMGDGEAVSGPGVTVQRGA